MPKNTWKDKDAYDRKAAELAERFQENFTKFMEGVDDAIVQAGPKIGT